MEEAYLSALRAMAKELKELKEENNKLRRWLNREGKNDVIIELIPKSRYDRIWSLLASCEASCRSWLANRRQSSNNGLGTICLLEVINNQCKLIDRLEEDISESHRQLRIEKNNNPRIRLIPKARHD